MQLESIETQSKNALQALQKNSNDLQEGHLYTVVNGNLQELPRDTEDTLRKVKLMQWCWSVV